MIITIKGRVPSKKNSRKAIYVRGRTIMVPNDRYEEWHEEALAQFQEQESEREPLKLRLQYAKIDLNFYPPNRLRSDLTNKAESVMDLLVDYGVLRDDNWFNVPELKISMVKVDEANPRVEIYIH